MADITVHYIHLFYTVYVSHYTQSVWPFEKGDRLEQIHFCLVRCSVKS